MKLRRIFLDTDLRSAFQGLRKIAKEADTMLEDNTVLFINRAMTAFKIIHNDTYLVYYRNGHRRIPLEALIQLPQSFGGSELEMQGAIKRSLMQSLNKK